MNAGGGPAAAPGVGADQIISRRGFTLAGPPPWHVMAQDVAAFDRLLPSVQFAGRDPANRHQAVELEIMVGRDGRYSPGLSLGVVPHASAGDYRSDPAWGVRVATDHLICDPPANGYSVILRPHGRLTEATLTVTTYCRRPVAPGAVAGTPDNSLGDSPALLPRTAWGRVLPVPARSQMTESAAIAHRLCSPTSVAMTLAYWGVDVPTATVASRVYDPTADIYGHWGFNATVAGQLAREVGVPVLVTATKLGGLACLEAEIAAGRPVVISHRWSPGELDNAPLATSAGHLIVVVGFTADGDVVVNDPAGDPRRGQGLTRTYQRAQLRHTWLTQAQGIAYTFARL